MKKILKILGVSFLCFQAQGSNVLLKAVDEVSQVVGYKVAKINLKKGKIGYLSITHPEVGPNATARIVGLDSLTVSAYAEKCRNKENFKLINLLNNECKDELEAAVRNEKHRVKIHDVGIEYLKQKYPDMSHRILSQIFDTRTMHFVQSKKQQQSLTKEQKADLDAAVAQKIAEENEKTAEYEYIKETYPEVLSIVVGQVIGGSSQRFSFHCTQKHKEEITSLSPERKREIDAFMEAIQGKLAVVRAKVGYIESKYPGHSDNFIGSVIGIDAFEVFECRKLENSGFLSLLSRTEQDSIDFALQNRIMHEKACTAYLHREFPKIGKRDLARIVKCPCHLIVSYLKEDNTSLIETLSEDTKEGLKYWGERKIGREASEHMSHEKL